MRLPSYVQALTASLLICATAAFAAGPGPIGSEFEVDGAEMAHLPLAFPEAGGAYVVLWNGSDFVLPFDARLRRYDAIGMPIAPAAPLNPPLGFVDVGRDAAGNFVVTHWGSDGSSYGVFARRFDAAGSALGPPFQVNTTTGGRQDPTSIGVDSSGAFMIVWESHAQLGIFARVYDAAASPVVGEFLVTPIGSTNGSRVIADGAGNFVVVWHETTASNVDVFARRYDGTGTALGPQFQVNTYTTGPQAGAELAALGGGAFVIVWAGQGPAGYSTGPFGQRYDATGAQVGSQFAVGGGVPGGGARVVAGSGGEFVVTWSAATPADILGGVAARSFDSAGLPLGPDVAVNTYTPGFTHNQHAVVHPGGDFTVFWDTDDIGVRGQRFSATGVPVPGDVSIDGQRLIVRDRPDPTRRRLTFGSRDPSSANGINPVVRPDVQGMYLHVYNSATGDSACMPLPASGWDPYDGLEDPFFYRDPTNANGPCHKAKLIRNKRFLASCRGAGISYTLDEVSQGSVAVAAILGDARYCTVFGGTVAKDSGPDGVFKARNAPRPTACPVPPVPCP